MPQVKAEWEVVRQGMHPNHVRSFQKGTRGLMADVTELTCGSALMTAGRPRPATPGILLAGLRRGFAEAFDL
jgi:hypothetical protein